MEKCARSRAKGQAGVSADVTNIWTLGVSVLGIQLPGEAEKEKPFSERQKKNVRESFFTF